jgi:hypothetical protein
MDARCVGCPIVEQLRFSQALVVEMQHALRELRHELENTKAEAAGWPLVERT